MSSVTRTVERRNCLSDPETEMAAGAVPSPAELELCMEAVSSST